MKAFMEVALALVLLSVVPGRSSPQVQESDADFTAIDAYIQSQMTAWHIPGAALVIVQNEQTSHLQTFGSAGKDRPITPSTPFETGSCSKSITALAFLVDGLLALAAFFGLPLVLVRQKWRGMFIWQPDAVYWCLAAGIVLLVKLGLRVLWLVGGKTKQTVTADQPVSPKKGGLWEGPAPLQ